MSSFKRFVNFVLLIGLAVLICIFGVGAFVLAKVRHINPVWVLLCLISVGFLAWVREEYRKAFRSPRFLIFVCCWLVINAVVFVFVLSSFGWLVMFLALFVEQVLFYMTADWFFGLRQPLRGERKDSEKSETTLRNRDSQ